MLHKGSHRQPTQRITKASIEALEDRRLMSFSPAVNYSPDATPSFVATGDFNNDGKLDLVTCANVGTGSVSVLLGNGAGGFGAAQKTLVGENIASMAVADFDEDGRLDVIAADVAYSTLRLLKGNGNGTFQPPVSMSHQAYLGGVTTGDFNNDNHADLLVSYSEWDSATNIYEVELGDGHGCFWSASDYWDQYAPYSSAGMTTVDLNNDHKLDVVNADVDVFMGKGDGTLQIGSHFAALGGAVASGDFTGDGKADLVVAGTNVTVLRGRGDGTFQTPLVYAANGSAHTAVATADFNADGKLDAAVTDGDTGTVSIMLGNGDGMLRYATAFNTGTSPSGVVVGDLNRDGRPDIAVSNAGSPSKNVSVLLNDGNWTVLPPPPVTPTLSISDAMVTEGNTGTRNATFTLTLSKPASAEVSVYYNTADITALAGSDFDYTSGLVTIPAGQTSKTITISVKGDRLPEPGETFSVNLISPTNATIADGQGIGTILDNEPRISIDNVNKAEGRSGTTTFTFTVSLSAAYEQTVTVKYVTANGTAKAGTDYTSKSGTLTFAPGETIKTITISVLGDKQKESNETFFVDLFGASSNALISGSGGIGTILDDDSSLLTGR